MINYHIIIDLEFNPVAYTEKKAKGIKNEIIEIGAVKLNKHFKIIDRFRCFVKPQYNYQITPKISRLTGIHTATVFKAETFGNSLEQFVKWIGSDEKVRVYSWSDTDLQQIIRECQAKNIPFPTCMKRWIDIQRIFPRMMKIANDRRKIALSQAVNYLGIDINHNKAHDALYDAEVTTEVLVPLLTGEYKEQVNCLNSLMYSSAETSKLGDVCGGVLMNLLMQMQMETA